MRKAVRLAAVAAFAILQCGGASAGGFAPKSELEKLTGTYASGAVEPWYGAFGTREFTFGDGNWSLTFTHALDPEMKMKTFVFRTGGDYRIEAPSAAVPGAFEAVFDEDWKKLTSYIGDPKMAEQFGFAPCGLTVGAEKDISADGCAAWKPVPVCGEDHDLLAMDEAGLYFGVRPADNDMCTPDKRPTALLMPVVRR
jgi:hypothetical protein